MQIQEILYPSFTTLIPQFIENFFPCLCIVVSQKKQNYFGDLEILISIFAKLIGFSWKTQVFKKDIYKKLKSMSKNNNKSLNKDLQIIDLKEKSYSNLPVQIKHQLRNNILKERAV